MISEADPNNFIVWLRPLHGTQDGNKHTAYIRILIILMKHQFASAKSFSLTFPYKFDRQISCKPRVKKN
jgi:hypothetical protein